MQANYTAIVQNYVTYAGYLPSLFWNGALLTNVNNSFSNSIGVASPFTVSSHGLSVAWTLLNISW